MQTIKDVVIIIVFFLLGCDCAEPLGDFYVSEACTPREVELIEIGLERASAYFKTDMQIVGRRDNNDARQDSRDSIFCIHDPDRKIVRGDLVAWGFHIFDDIYMFSEVIHGGDDLWLGVFMHELGHYAGLRDSDDPEDLMYRYVQNPPKLEY